MPDSEQAWNAPPDNLSLPENEVHVWLASLAQPEVVMLQLKQTLSHDELIRAGKFHFDKDRDYYMAARGLLRSLLGRYLDMQPAQLQFAYNEYGKPLLSTSLQGKFLNFNLSH